MIPILPFKPEEDRNITGYIIYSCTPFIPGIDVHKGIGILFVQDGSQPDLSMHSMYHALTPLFDKSW